MKSARTRSFVWAIVITSAICIYSAWAGRDLVAVAGGLRKPATSGGDVEAIRQLGRSMGDAMVALDMETLDRIFGDDWAAVSKSGKVENKQEMLASSRTGGDHRLLSYELGPIDVQVLGDLAVAHGTVKERRLVGGKQVDMEGVYMDFLKKRSGRWVVVRSAGGMLEPQS